jgi:hypothetical protein
VRLPLPSLPGWAADLAPVGSFGPWVEWVDDVPFAARERELVSGSSLCLQVESPPRGAAGRVFFLHAFWSSLLGWRSLHVVGARPGLLGALLAEVAHAGVLLFPPDGLALTVARAAPPESDFPALLVMES